MILRPPFQSCIAYINEEGKFDQKANPPNRLATQISYIQESDWIAGTMVIFGPNDGEGNETPIPDGIARELLSLAAGSGNSNG